MNIHEFDCVVFILISTKKQKQKYFKGCEKRQSYRNKTPKFYFSKVNVFILFYNVPNFIEKNPSLSGSNLGRNQMDAK